MSGGTQIKQIILYALYRYYIFFLVCEIFYNKKDKNLLIHFKGKEGYLFLHIQLVKFFFSLKINGEKFSSLMRKPNELVLRLNIFLGWSKANSIISTTL